MDNEKFKNKYRIESCRLKGWDYRREGYYFVTICVDDQTHFFGEVKDKKMYLSEFGRWADDYWREIPKHFLNVRLDEYVVMPNHIHGIVIIGNKDINKVIDLPDENKEIFDVNNHSQNPGGDEAMPRLYPDQSTPALKEFMSKISPKSGSLSVIIGAFKSAYSKKIHEYDKDFIWQERFYDQIIRDEISLYNIQQYIIDNPDRWERDRNNPPQLFM